jgi:peptidoglycan/xylan/chitin deacetylase (PgdA/CDA1 family)
MQKGAFIFSLDCEGYWGLADRVSDGADLGWRSDMLASTYSRLVELFDRFEVPATWAFVAAFVHTPDEVAACPYLSEEPIPYRGRDWSAAFKAAWGRGDTDGWLCPRALELVRAAGGHEIAAHGFSHLPLDEASTTEEAAARELDLLAGFWSGRRLRPSTFVFPRNQPGYLGRVAEHFEAYRPPHPLEDRRDTPARLRRLVDEINLWAGPSGQGHPGRPAALPPAMLLNHRAGGRRLVPQAVTVARVRRLLRRAAECAGVVHLYSHPHNFLTGRGQFELLERVLGLVAGCARAGELQPMTQAEYAARLTGGTHPRDGAAVLGST